MIFFIWGIRSRRSLATNPEEVLQGYDACVRCGHRPVRVVDTTRSCHFCFVPLFPVSQSSMVVCTACQLPAALPFHLQQSRMRGEPPPPSTPPMTIPVAKMIRIVREDDIEPSSKAQSPTAAAEGDFASAAVSESIEAPTSNAVGEEVMASAHRDNMDNINRGEHIPLVEAKGATIV